jgi:glycosyltransferase involved in cell wall biosynthesis
MTNLDTTSADNRVRVVYVLPCLVASGGIERQFLAQMKCINTARYDVHLITLFTYLNRPMLYDALPPHVHVHRLAIKPGFGIGGWWQLYRLLRQLRPHIVVSSMVAANTIARLLQPLCGYVAIAREHNTYTDKNFWHKLRDHICAYVSPTIVAVSRSVADFASTQAHIPRQKFTVIHNGIDNDVIKNFIQTEAVTKIAALRTDLGITESTKILLNVARLKPQKNHRLLIDGFEKFCQTHPHEDVLLCIVGIGSEEQNLRQYITECHLQDRIKLMGYRDDVYTFYAAATAFVLTSDIEGFPNVALEALAFGVPVLSTLVSGIDEILTDGKQGRIMERTPESVCATIAWILGMPQEEYEHCAKVAQATAETFSVSNIVARYETLFESLMKNGI